MKLENRQRLDQLIERLHKLAESDISRSEFGEPFGFSSCERMKNDFANFGLALVSDIDRFKSDLNPFTVDAAVHTLWHQTDSLESYVLPIKQFTQADVNTEAFPQKRQHSVDRLSDLLGMRYEFRGIQLEIEVSKLKRSFVALEAIPVVRENAENSLGEVREIADQVKSILDTLRTRVAEVAVSESVGTFNNLKANHERYERFWFWIFVLFSGTTIAAFTWGAFGAIPSTNSLTESVAIILQRVFLISASVVFLKIALTKYNTERNLRVIYDHRQTVLTQYATFESAISDDDREAKSAFRLEIAKYVFSDPQTGYLKPESSAGDVNVNPIIHLVDRMAKGT